MAATVIDGKASAAKLREKIAAYTTDLKSRHGLQPGLAMRGPRLPDPQHLGRRKFLDTSLKASVGLTLLRILTPVGPLSLEYAYPLTQGLAEEQWKRETSALLHWPGRIHFNWGIPILR